MKILQINKFLRKAGPFAGVCIFLFSMCMSSCNDFLDQVPDNRTDLNSPEQISKLLVNGYSTANHALISELSGDNFVDNNSPDSNGNRYNLPVFELMDNEIFAWEDVVSGERQDSPHYLWEDYYRCIAVANHALRRIYELEKEGRTSEVSAQKGEALLIRAFNHFNLVNIFAQAFRSDALNKATPGIPYITEPEKTVIVIQERLSLAEVYEKIEKDLLEGLPLIDDRNYKVPKYHFNKQAAHAFAARFYLFKRDYEKVIEHANLALGQDASLYMKDWSPSLPTYNSFVYWTIDELSRSNFLLIPTHSRFMRRYSESYRYTCNREAVKATIFGQGPSWMVYSYHPCFVGKLYVSGKQQHGIWCPNSGEVFEFTDKVAGIGYPHIIRKEFTAEETLLCRAEAWVHLKEPDKALADLEIWNKARQNLPIPILAFTLGHDNINAFYSRYAEKDVVKPLNTEKIDSSWQVDEEQTLMLYCVLHFRRIETIFEGNRWFDIKRYGIEIEHKIGRDRVEYLKWDDPRRAIQLPAEVIVSGILPNNREAQEKSTPEVIKSEDNFLEEME
ncbi:MAG: RagB/SusD family nutrient uptake outer membrane protein [Bacteroidales bacterium]|nr:RagB/SusD family nutrient uptake outer membrane protein [Bacteroidales bacterium]